MTRRTHAPGSRSRLAGLLVLGLALGCSRSSSEAPLEMEMDAEPMAEMAPAADFARDEEMAVGGMGGRAEKRRAPVVAKGMAADGRSMDDAPPGRLFARILPSPEPMAAAESARVRTWFPEAFLWRPSLVTDAEGRATLDVRVPDQLTTWRVLALAHDRNGHQAGTTHTFDSVLPVSIDPVTPDWMYTGDTFVLPGQASAIGQPFQGRVELSSSGSLSGSGRGPVDLQPGGSRLVEATVTAESSGGGRFLAELLGPEGARVDGAERVIQVRPTGRPVHEQLGGVLSGRRALAFDHPQASEEQVLVRVFPGPLSLFQAELDRVGSSPSGAYGYALLAGIEALSATAGVEVDHEALRTLRIRAWQQLVRASRNPDGPESMALLTGLSVPAEDALAQLTHDRLVRTLEAQQRGDGTWSADARSTVQHVLVQTAASARALPADRKGARVRASGALERLLPNVEDPYTAAWVLASGVVDPSLHAGLLETVQTGLEEVDGRWRLAPLPSGSRGPHGWVTRTEQLAVTWLALAGADPTSRQAGDLLAELLGSWDASRGFGGRWSDALALQAIRQGLPSLDQPVAISIERDGQVLGSGSLDPSQPKLPVVLETGPGPFELTAEPAVPGLVFAASHTAWVPFTGEERLPGVEVELALGALRAGEQGTLTLSVSAPSGAVVELAQGLPAGTSVEIPPTTLAQLTGHTITQDQVQLTTKPFGAGEVLELTLQVTPMYAGQMTTRPLHVASGREAADLRPLVWTVR